MKNLSKIIIFVLLSSLSSEALEVPSGTIFNAFGVSFEAQGSVTLRTTIVLKKSDQSSWTHTLVSINNLSGSWNNVSLNIFHGQYSNLPYSGSGIALSTVQSTTVDWSTVGANGGIGVILNLSQPTIYVEKIIFTKETTGTLTIRNLIVDGSLKNAGEFAESTPTNTPVSPTNTNTSVPPATNTPTSVGGVFFTYTPIPPTPTFTSMPVPVVIGPPVPTKIPIPISIPPEEKDRIITLSKEQANRGYVFGVNANGDGNLTYVIKTSPKLGNVSNVNSQIGLFQYKKTEGLDTFIDEGFTWTVIELGTSQEFSDFGSIRFFVGLEPTPTPLPTATATPTTTSTPSATDIVEATVTPRITDLPATPTQTATPITEVPDPTATNTPKASNKESPVITYQFNWNFKQYGEGKITIFANDPDKDTISQKIGIESIIVDSYKNIVSGNLSVITININTEFPGTFPLQVSVSDGSRTRTVLLSVTIERAVMVTAKGTNSAYNLSAIFDKSIDIDWGLYNTPTGTNLFHILLNQDNEIDNGGNLVFHYLGQTSPNKTKRFSWLVPGFSIHPDYRTGPMNGSFYRFKIASILGEKDRQYIESEKEYLFVKSDKMVFSKNIGYDIVVAFNTEGSRENLLNIDQYHFYVKEGSNPNWEYLGRTIGGENNLLQWNYGFGENGSFIDTKFQNGPRLNTQYQFGVYVIYKEKENGMKNSSFYTINSQSKTSTQIVATPTITLKPVIIVPTTPPAPTSTIVVVVPTATPTRTNTPVVPPIPTSTNTPAPPTATPTPSPTQLPWNYPQPYWLSLDTPEQKNYFSIAPDNQAQHGFISWDKELGMVLATTMLPTGEWLKVRQDVFFDPQIKPYVVIGVTNNSTQQFMVVPTGIWRIEDSSGYKYTILSTPSNVKPAINIVTGGKAHFFTFDMREIIELVKKEIPSLTGDNLAGIDYIDWFLRADLPGDHPQMWWDYVGFLSPEEMRNNTWKTHADEENLLPLYEESVGISNLAPSSVATAENFIYYSPPKSFFTKEIQNENVIFVNPGNFSER